MNTIATADDTQIYYKNRGKGRPVVFSHGWPFERGRLGRSDGISGGARIPVHRA